MVKQTSSVGISDDASRPDSPMKKKTSHADKLQSTSTPSFTNWATRKQESFDVSLSIEVVLFCINLTCVLLVSFLT